MDFRVVEAAGRDLLGEGPVWSPARNCLFWVDILAPSLRRLGLHSDTVDTWLMPEKIGWAIERKDREDLIIGLKSGFARLDLDPFVIEPIGNPEPDRPHNRLNDAKADRHGAIWAGSKDESDQERSGALHRLAPDLTWHRHDDGYLVANGPTFSTDGDTLYHTDSGDRTIYAFDLAEDGSLCRKRIFATFEEAWGYPDGMTTDIDGGIWVAHWGGGKVSRFSPNGVREFSIDLPATNITSVAFAGDDLSRMFVTSSGHGLSGEPRAGALFELFTGYRGVAPMTFG